MVAMSGAIMPEPLAMPLSVTSARRRSSPCGVATFSKVSVVMMAAGAVVPGIGLRRILDQRTADWR